PGAGGARGAQGATHGRADLHRPFSRGSALSRAGSIAAGGAALALGGADAGDARAPCARHGGLGRAPRTVAARPACARRIGDAGIAGNGRRIAPPPARTALDGRWTEPDAAPFARGAEGRASHGVAGLPP